MATGTSGSEEIALRPATARDERRVREEFWPKIKRTLAHIPFAADAVAAWYCAFDSSTPIRVRGILIAALAYFILPFDVVPDFILGVGFTDDLTVLVTAVGLIRSHMRPEHYEKARQTIERLRRGEDPEARTV